MLLRHLLYACLCTAISAAPTLWQRQQASWDIIAAEPPTLAPGQNSSGPQSFLLYNADEVHYPFTVHLPDRETRGLPPLDGPWPVILSLSGSGARGPASQAKVLSGYDGASRKVRQYNEGNRSSAHLLAAEEFLVVTPICPNETAQPDASWDIDIFPNILAQVAVQYNIDLTRIYLSTYSMGARAAWNLLMQYPDIFAGSIISSGATYADTSLLKDLLGNSIRNYYGTIDEFGLTNATLNTQQRWNQAAASYIQRNSSSIYRTRILETVGPILGADHLVMNERPWDEDVITDGYAGALAWLLGQRRLEGAVLNFNSSVCTTCIPPSPLA